ncbi:MAG: glutathione S-transferase N-terminal domain-containing protein, partial [Caldimonas sp.]
MKLYYSPGACSLSPHIVLHESGLAFEPVLASTKTHKLQDGTDYYTINSKGYVPLLELDDGTRLSEGPVIVQYIADQVPAKKLAPAAGTMERYRLQEWLNFITSELHKGFGAIFNPAMPEEGKAVMRARVTDKLKWVDAQLEGKDYT